MKKLLYSLAFLALAPLAWWLAQREAAKYTKLLMRRP